MGAARVLGLVLRKLGHVCAVAPSVTARAEGELCPYCQSLLDDVAMLQGQIDEALRDLAAAHSAWAASGGAKPSHVQDTEDFIKGLKFARDEAMRDAVDCYKRCHPAQTADGISVPLDVGSLVSFGPVTIRPRCPACAKAAREAGDAVERLRRLAADYAARSVKRASRRSAPGSMRSTTRSWSWAPRTRSGARCRKRSTATRRASSASSWRRSKASPTSASACWRP